MGRRSVRVCLLVWAGVLGPACTGVGVDPLGMQIVEDVEPIEPMAMERVCVRVNTGVKQQFTDGVFDTLKELGLQAQSMQTAFAGECPYWLRYEAAWDGFPSYLTMAHIEVYEGSTRLGHALYDARRGGGRPDRFGSAMARLRPLLTGLFHHVQREAAAH